MTNSSLTVLDLSNNNMEGKIYIPNILKTLIISNNKFNSVELVDNENESYLENFEADHNNFNENEVNGFLQLQQLRIMRLSYNKFTKFPHELKQLKQLTTLYLNDNKMTGYLTSDMLKFENLNSLALWNNELEGDLIIPPNLIELDIDNNYFSSYSSHNNNKKLIII